MFKGGKIYVQNFSFSFICRASPSFNKEMYVDFIAAQIKTLSFLAYIIRIYQVGLGHKKKKILFYRRTDLPIQVGSVGWAFFFSFFFFLVAKMTLKTQKFQKIIWLFSAKIVDFGQKMADITRFWKNKKKNLPKWKILVDRTRKTVFFFGWGGVLME